jgi:protein-tyrosine-phosphatase
MTVTRGSSNCKYTMRVFFAFLVVALLGKTLAIEDNRKNRNLHGAALRAEEENEVGVPNFSINCQEAGRPQSSALKPEIWDVQKYPSSRASLRTLFGFSPSNRKLKFAVCEYVAPQPAQPIPGPAGKPFYVPVLLNYRQNGAALEFKGAFVLAPSGHTADPNNARIARFRGFRLVNKNVDPLGQQAVLVKKAQSTLRLSFSNVADRSTLLELANTAAPQVLFVCAGNTGRSPLAAALAKLELIGLNAEGALRIESRGFRVNPAETRMEQEVIDSVKRVQPDAEYLPALIAHTAQQYQLQDIANSLVVLTVNDAIARDFRNAVGRATRADGSLFPIYTIRQWIGDSNLDIDDPWEFRKTPREHAKYDAMVKQMMEFIPKALEKVLRKLPDLNPDVELPGQA